MNTNKIILIVIATLMGIGCGAKKPMDVEKTTTDVKPKSSPVRNITNFGESLKCMDQLLGRHGVKGIAITSEGLPDYTGEIYVGTKDMMITAVSMMSAKNGGFRFIDFDQGQRNINALQDAVGASFELPKYYIRGSITQFDEKVNDQSASGGISIPGVDLSADAGEVASVISMDLNVGDLIKRQIISGISANNSISVMSKDKSANAGGIIEKAGLSFAVNMSQNEGMHQAVRTLLELSLIEVLGKLTNTPYEECLQLDSTSPITEFNARDKYDDLDYPAKIRFVQVELQKAGYYDGTATGELDSATKRAISKYQKDNNLIPSGRMSFQLFNHITTGDAPVYEPQSQEPAVVTVEEESPAAEPEEEGTAEESIAGEGYADDMGEDLPEAEDDFYTTEETGENDMPYDDGVYDDSADTGSYEEPSQNDGFTDEFGGGQDSGFGADQDAGSDQIVIPESEVEANQMREKLLDFLRGAPSLKDKDAARRRLYNID